MTGLPVGNEPKIWQRKYSALLLSKTEEKGKSKIMIIVALYI